MSQRLTALEEQASTAEWHLNEVLVQLQEMRAEEVVYLEEYRFLSQEKKDLEKVQARIAHDRKEVSKAKDFFDKKLKSLKEDLERCH